MNTVLVSASPLDVLQHSNAPTPIILGSENTREIRVAAESFDQGSMNFTQTLGANLIMDRTVLIEYEIQAVFTSADANPCRYDNSDIALASFPLNRVCSNAVVTLNGNSKGLPIRDFQAALNWYQNQSWFDTATLACCPSCPDGINNLQGSGRPPG